MLNKIPQIKPFQSLKGAKGVADDVAEMAPIAEFKNFATEKVAGLMKPGQHKWYSPSNMHNAGVSSMTKLPVSHAVNPTVTAFASGGANHATTETGR